MFMAVFICLNEICELQRVAEATLQILVENARKFASHELKQPWLITRIALRLSHFTFLLRCTL